MLLLSYNRLSAVADMIYLFYHAAKTFAIVLPWYSDKSLNCKCCKSALGGFSVSARNILTGHSHNLDNLIDRYFPCITQKACKADCIDCSHRRNRVRYKGSEQVRIWDRRSSRDDVRLQFPPRILSCRFQARTAHRAPPTPLHTLFRFPPDSRTHCLKLKRWS